MKKLNLFIKKALLYLVCFILIIYLILFELILTSDSSLKDFFCSHKQIKNNQHKHIIVDALQVNDSGGIAILTQTLLNEIAKKRPNWRFTVLLPKSDQTFLNFTNKNIKTLQVNYNYTNMLIPFKELFNYALFGKYHDQIEQILSFNTVVFDNDSCDLIFNVHSEFSLNDFKVPKVSIIHDLMHTDLQFYASQHSWTNTSIPITINTSRRIITVSNFTKNRLIAQFKANENLITPIHIKLAKRLQSSNLDLSILKKFDLSAKNYFIYNANVRKHKNHKSLILAFADFIEKHPKSTLKLVYTGTITDANKEILYNLIKNETIKKRIIFTQFVSKKELQTLISKSLALIFPSLYEGFGMPIVEAMAIGIPVACSNTASLPEVAEDAALYFDPLNINDIEKAIEKIAFDQALRNDLIQKGLQRSRYFTDTDSMINEYIKVLEQSMKHN